MKLWISVLAGGFGLMLWSYFGFISPDATSAWSHGFLLLSADENTAESGRLRTNQWSVQVRFLTLPSETESLVDALGVSAERKHTLRAQLGTLLVAVPANLPGLNTNLLAFGRLPVPGEAEVVAGCQVQPTNRINVADQEFRVVGGLKRDAVAWADSFLLLESPRWQGLFSCDQPVTYRGIAQLSGAESIRSHSPAADKERGHPGKWAVVRPSLRAHRVAYTVYVAGMALLLLGGSGLFVGSLRRLAQANLPALLRDPLRQMTEHPRLLWSVHVGYFGIMLLCALIMYQLPSVQKLLGLLTQDQLSGGIGPLGLAGKAYTSGNVAFAAAVTFFINFWLGALACLTLPSLLLPGFAVAFSALRACLWGILLPPVSADMARSMLPHSFTVWLEGEAYILATVLAMLIPLALLRREPGVSVVQRYLQAVSLNLKGLIWCAIVVLIAALYEAVEVILIVSRG